MRNPFLPPSDHRQAAWAVLGLRTRLRLPAIAAAVGILGGVPSLGHAATLHVDRNNSQCIDSGSGTPSRPFCKIGAAAARAVAGDTVLVQSGTYSERVVVPISGTAGAPIVFNAVGTVTVTGQTYGFDLSGRSWITVQGFTISDTTDDGIRALVSSDLTISDNQVINAGGVGIEARDCSNVTISNNDIREPISHGIFVKFCGNVTVAENHVIGAGQPFSGLNKNGININGCADSHVIDNITENNSDHGIYVTGASTRINVKGNITHHNAREFVRAAAGMEIRGSSNNTVEGNKTYQNEDSGMNIRSNANNNLVINNLSYNNGDHGIDHLGVSNGKIIGNTVYGNFKHGLEIEGGSTGLTVANNICVANGLTTGEANIRTAANSVQGTTPDYNIVFMSAPGVMYTWGDVNYASLAALRVAQPTLEVHGIQADPRWVAPASGNFHLSAGSPAIDSANSGVSGASATDLEGRPRFDHPGTPNTGAGPRGYDDRGAFEFQISSPSNTAPRITSGPGATPDPVLSGQTADLSVTATDDDNDPLTYDWRVPVGEGTISGTGPEVTFVPAAVTTSRVVRISVEVADGRGGTDTGTVDLTVAPRPAPNSPPRITSGPSATPNPVRSDETADLAITATDADNDPLTYSWTVPAGGGSISGTGPAVTYLPPAVTDTRAFTISAEVSDGAGGRTEGVVDVTVTPAATSQLLSFRPAADAWVNQSSPTQNQGAAKTLKIDGKAINTTFLRFTVTGITGPVQSAWIELEVRGASADGGTIRPVAANGWGEFTITYGNQPTIGGSALDTTGAVTVGEILQLDVTPAISQNGTYSFAITGNGSRGWSVRSREGSANTPMLFINAGSSS